MTTGAKFIAAYLKGGGYAGDPRFPFLEMLISAKIGKVTKERGPELTLVTPQVLAVDMLLQSVGITQAQLSDRIGVSRAVISKLKAGGGTTFLAPSTLDKLEALAKEYGMAEIGDYFHTQAVIGREKVSRRGGRL